MANNALLRHTGIFGKIMRKLREASEKVYVRNQVSLRRITQIEANIFRVKGTFSSPASSSESSNWAAYNGH